MGRAIFDDITPPHKDSIDSSGSHSIRNVSPVDTHERAQRRERRAGRRMFPENNNRTRSRGLGNIIMWAGALCVFGIALTAIGFVFMGKTTITVTPHQETFALSENVIYTAYKDASDTELGFTVLTDTFEASATLPATGSEEVREKASGRITVYNAYSSTPQRLIKNTRFEAPNGEIYRVRNSIVVPGKNPDGTPGSLEITVYADKEGEEQNITDMNTRFTIPGLKGDPRYEAFYATLKEPIVGGFVGQRAVVDEGELNALRTKLREELRSAISAADITQSTDERVVFDDGVFVTFESAPLTYTNDETAKVKEIARVHVVGFDHTKFARAIATTALATPIGGEIRIADPESLNFKIVNRDGVDIVSDSILQFTLAGPVTLVWQVDAVALANDLAGKHSTALNAVMSAYPGIKTAEATIRPFWKKEFPSDPKNISVIVTEPKN